MRLFVRLCDPDSGARAKLFAELELLQNQDRRGRFSPLGPRGFLLQPICLPVSVAHNGSYGES